MKIEHIALYVKDLESAKDFWVNNFGGKANDKYVNERKGFESYFIQFEDGSRLELMHQKSRKDIPDSNYLGYAHVAVHVGTEETVQKLTEKFQNDGYEIISEPRITGDGYYESCVMDGEGNIIELTA